MQTNYMHKEIAYLKALELHTSKSSSAESIISHNDLKKLHQEILSEHELKDYYEETLEIFNHLNFAIGLSFPRENGDSIKVYAAELFRLLDRKACKYYLYGTTYRLETQYGLLEAGKWSRI